MRLLLSDLIKTKLEKLLVNVGDMSLKRRARKIIEALNPRPGEKIMDLGCGTGYYLFLLSNLPIRLYLTGYDNDEKALNEAKDSLRNKGIEFILGDSHKLNLRENSFNKIVASEVLEHLEDDEKALSEIYKILKPGGILLVSTPSINYPLFWDPINWILQRVFDTHIKTGFLSGIWSGHMRLYKKSDLERKFNKVGFEIEASEELTSWCLPFNHYIVNAIARLLYDVKISSKTADSLSKFKNTKRPFIIDLAFKFVNSIDKLNEIFPKKNGVNVFIVGRKTT